MPLSDHRYYFIHIMKTAGGTFKRHIARNFDRDACYPPLTPPDGRDDVYLSTLHLQSLSPEERARYQVFTGHYPAATRHLLGDDVVTLTLLRDPVERTLSHIKMIQRLDPKFADHTLTEVYDDAASREFFFHDYQVRIFAYDDPATPNAMTHLELDDARLEIARRNLDAVDVIGFREDLGDFLDEVQTRYGWAMHENVRSKNVADPVAIDPGLRERVERDSALDVEFYRWARERHGAAAR